MFYLTFITHPEKQLCCSILNVLCLSNRPCTFSLLLSSSFYFSFFVYFVRSVHFLFPFHRHSVVTVCLCIVVIMWRVCSNQYDSIHISVSAASMLYTWAFMYIWFICLVCAWNGSSACCKLKRHKEHCAEWSYVSPCITFHSMEYRKKEERRTRQCVYVEKKKKARAVQQKRESR